MSATLATWLRSFTAGLAVPIEQTTAPKTTAPKSTQQQALGLDTAQFKIAEPMAAASEVTHLAELYEYLYLTWQQPSARRWLASLDLLIDAANLDWLTPAEADSWLQLYGQRLAASYPNKSSLITALHQEDLRVVNLTSWQQNLIENWCAFVFAAPQQLEQELDLTQPQFQPLQVRTSPMGYALAVRASSFVVYQQDLTDPASLKDKFWPDVEATLNEHWQVHSSQDCKQLLYWLAGQGQRYAWQLDTAWLLQASEPDRALWQAEMPEEQQNYAEALLNLPEVLLNSTSAEMGTAYPDVAAWDWVRMADLALAGYLAGYLSATEGRNFALMAVWLLRSRYASWQAIADSYLLGYKLWQAQTGISFSPHLETTWQQLLSLPFSPMQQLDWCKLNLDHIDFRAAKTSFAAGLDDPLVLVGLLASVRDESGLLTGLAPNDLSPARSAEAQEYLFSSLKLSEHASLTSSLARFWQPGLVHHYDQLALNCRIQKQPQLAPGLPQVAEIEDIWHLQTPELAALTKQPAAIAMVEKYAFYLLKAQEAAQYPALEVRQLAVAVQNYLSWHYSSAWDLLQAWYAWEEVLSQAATEKDLLPELNWHRQDAGSLFKFLRWRQPPVSFIEPGTAVSEADLATLNLVGPLTGIHWSWPEQLPTALSTELKLILLETHLLQTASDLHDYLDYLYHAGDRQEYLVAYAPFTLNPEHLEQELAANAPVAEAALLEETEAVTLAEQDEEQASHYQRLLRVQHNAYSVNDLDLTAWDMAQLVDLAIAGYQVNWLSAAELKDWLARVRQLLVQEYSGWDEFALALLAGYNFFMPESSRRAEQLEIFSQRLLSLLVAVPPQVGLWYTLAWPGDKNRKWEQAAIVLSSGQQRLH